MLVAQVLNLLYSIVDRIYIGRIEGEGAIALGAASWKCEKSNENYDNSDGILYIDHLAADLGKAGNVHLYFQYG